MSVFNILLFLFLVVGGIGNAVIDYRHQKKDGYIPGHAWSYYSKLSKAGSWEGKFMMWSGYIAIALIILVTALTFYKLAS